MGLDMYLTKKTYVRNWDHYKPEERFEIIANQGGKPIPGVDPKRIMHIEELVCQWRKANAIHQWCVDNVQDGNDDCKEYYVSEEQLQELVDTCQRVLDGTKTVRGKVTNGYQYESGKKIPILEDGEIVEDSSVAEELLPTQEGFFFGGTQYDQYYIEDLKHTIETLTQVLKEDDGGEFYYQSSW